jgi:putative lumazine-binding protein
VNARPAIRRRRIEFNFRFQPDPRLAALAAAAEPARSTNDPTATTEERIRMPATPKLQAITETVPDYFEGTYYRDTSRLRKAFHPKACLSGHLQGAFVHLSLDQWLGMVESLPVPADSGEAFDD